MILGIDVGLTGAVAVLGDDGAPIRVFDLPVMASGKAGAKVRQQVNAGELARILRGLILSPGNLVIVEQQAAMPSMGVQTMFSLGHSFGIVCGVLAALDLPYLTVAPRTWKKHFGLDTSDKEVDRALAIKLFPTMELGLKKHHNRADALLLAAYGVARNRGGVAA